MSRYESSCKKLMTSVSVCRWDKKISKAECVNESEIDRNHFHFLAGLKLMYPIFWGTDVLV